MLIAALVLFGCALGPSHGASVAPFSLRPFANASLEGEDPTGVQAADGYVKLRPGTKIYFYATEDRNVVIGPKLRSGEDVSILVLDQDEDLKKYSQFKNSYILPDVYSVLKNGILVPRPGNARASREAPAEERNKCVYQSPKPTYYVRGFKNILIPVDVLYTKSKQEELFPNEKSLGPKAFAEPDSWRTDLKVSELKPRPEEEGEDDDDDDDGDGDGGGGGEGKPARRAKTSTWSSLRGKSRAPSSSLNSIDSRPEKPEISEDDVRPDKTCNGDVTLFVLEKDGVFRRVPSDPFLPAGMHLSYSLLRNLMLRPEFLGPSDVVLSYVTGENGDLVPHSENAQKVIAEDGGSVSFMLSKNGGLFPVREEEEDANRSVSYYFGGKLVHRSQQFTRAFSNATSVLINDKRVQVFEDVDAGEPPKRKRSKKHHLQKRSSFFGGYEGGSGAGGPPPEPRPVLEPPMVRQPVDRLVEYQPQPGRRPPPIAGEPPVVADRRADAIPPAAQPPPKMPPHYDGVPGGCPMRGRAYAPPGDPMDHGRELPEHPDQAPAPWDNPPLRPRTDIFIFDEKGTRIRLIPEITDTNDVVIYKLTCKGNLVRYPSCKEPEFGFKINFQLLLDEFVLVPTVQDGKPFLVTYVLQENGDLVPAEGNANTYRKAPGSLIYYMLGKNNVLFPVQQVIDMEGNVSFFYQDYFLLKMKDSTEKPLHFTTKGAPLFAFFNGFTMLAISSKPRLNPLRGSNWKQLKPSDAVEGTPKIMYLTGPKGELIKIAPYKNKQGATVVYELDCNGIFYRSPKDKKKCIILKSYMLIKDGILLPSNDTSGYVYMMSKNGDLFPYLYPDGKIEAPLASSLKYVLCEKGILLPIKLEIIDNYICYLFRDVVVYKERVYCKTCLDRLDEETLDARGGPRKSSCDLQPKEAPAGRPADVQLFVNKDGRHVFYEKQGKVLRRRPSEAVPAYLKYTMGSFEVKSDGSLHQIRYQDPGERVVNLMLEPNGDLLEDTRNLNRIRSDYFVLDAKGNLVSVEAKKTKKNFYFFKNHVRLCKIPIPGPEKPEEEARGADERRSPPLGKDPLGLMEDPLPGVQASNDSRSLYIPIPLKSVSLAEPQESCLECADKKKYEMLKDTLSKVSNGTSLPLALELELTDDIIQELKNWAAKCDKVISRRDVPEDLRTYLNDLNAVVPEKADPAPA